MAKSTRSNQSPRPAGVRVWEEDMVLPTYEPLPPDRNPMFLEKRVYQGSSGKVYPLPFYDRISASRRDRKWKAIHIANEFLSISILPEIGGRIHVLKDLVNGYDLIYNQEVIKPALVGLAGPWISGGIEFNWPQHHRPATYMPVDSHIEHGLDGSITVWLGDHDPMNRLKGMHGVCLHPGRAVMELKVRLYNRTPYTQSFLWWANVATKVHELYQSFFPPDVTYVADHAKRATSLYPKCDDHYYGVNYDQRGREGVQPGDTPRQFVPHLDRYAANDLSWYANIPVPTSYMCMGSREDFFGGYDHKLQAGIVHIANRHISPGKKQWTWGNHEFGYAWDRNLTDSDADGVYHPYIELMAGVFTDNQPDFSFLAAGETKTFSQFWYPIRKIGPAQQANVNAAISLVIAERRATVGLHVSQRFENATIELFCRGKSIWKRSRSLSTQEPLIEQIALPARALANEVRLAVTDQSGRELIAYQPKPAPTGEPATPAPATEPPEPRTITSADELYTIGLHLSQYRHATRMPEHYWQEALRRDPMDARCNTAMGHWHLHRGEFELAVASFERAVARQTSRNPNPADGDSHYGLGLSLRLLGRDEPAYDAFYKATWNQAQQSAAFLALAEIDLSRSEHHSALEHLDASLIRCGDHLRARNLRAIVLRKLGRDAEAAQQIQSTLALDPLDWFARHLAGENLRCAAAVRIDLAIDYARAGFFDRAIELLEQLTPGQLDGTGPMKHYYLAFYNARAGRASAATKHLAAAERADPAYCFPNRLEDFQTLSHAIAAGKPAQAHYLLGCWLYDRKRHAEAINHWEHSVALRSGNPTAWRNLGIGYFNISRSPEKSKRAYDRAVTLDPSDARLTYERDQLWKRLGESPGKRLKAIKQSPKHLETRDDLTVEFCALLNQTGQHQQARELLERRLFQPWEGGEGQALGQFVRTHLSLGRLAMDRGDVGKAVEHFERSMNPPMSLGEAKHLLANQSDVYFELGTALLRAGRPTQGKAYLRQAANFRGDFQDMSVRSYSEMTYFSAMSARALGNERGCQKMLRGLLAYAKSLYRQTARIDYFATSLPTMLLFDDDLQERQSRAAMLMEAQASHGLGKKSAAIALVKRLLKQDPNNALANDLLNRWERK